MAVTGNMNGSIIAIVVHLNTMDNLRVEAWLLILATGLSVEWIFIL